jgi:hypothetical protein
MTREAGAAILKPGPLDASQEEAPMSLRTIAVGASLMAVLMACSSAPANSTPTPGATAGATATPQAPVATATPETTVPGATPPFPSFASDPDLARQFPTQVAGQPVTDVTTVVFVDFLAGFGTTEAELETSRLAFAALGFDLDKVVFGAAQATVDGSSVSFQAFRVPGQDANRLIQNYTLLSTDNQGDTLEQASSGGKTVTVIKSADVASTWMYAHGDILWSVNTSDPDEAAAIFAALP